MYQNIYLKFFLIFIPIVFTVKISAQDNCFQSFKIQGNIALSKNDYPTAIQSFQSIIRNCDKASPSQRDEALSLLNKSYDLNELVLKESIAKAEEKAREAERREVEANMEREAKEREAINAQSSRIAYHASEETDHLDKLTLAYYSKKWLADIDTISQSSNAAFGDAVQENYKQVQISQNGFVNAATLINKDILVKGVNGEISIHNKKETKTFTAHKDHILSIIPYKSGFITTSKDKTAKYWEVGDKAKLTFALTGHQRAVNGVITSSDDSTILTYSKDKTAKIWDSQGNIMATLEGHTGAIYDALFSTDGEFILTRSQNKEVGLWDKEGKLITKSTHAAFVYDMAISNDNQLITSVTADGQIHLWDAKGELISQKAHENAIFNIEMASNNEHFLTVGADKQVKLWNKLGKLIQTFPNSSNIIYANFIKGEDKILVAAGDKIVIYNFLGKKLQSFSYTSKIISVNLSLDGQYFLTSYYDNTVKLWSVQGMELLALNLFNDQIIGLDFSESEEYILAYSQDGVVALCPTPSYIYEQLEEQPPVMTDDLRNRYRIKKQN